MAEFNLEGRNERSGYIVTYSAHDVAVSRDVSVPSFDGLLYRYLACNLDFPLTFNERRDLYGKYDDVVMTGLTGRRREFCKIRLENTVFRIKQDKRYSMLENIVLGCGETGVITPNQIADFFGPISPHVAVSLSMLYVLNRAKIDKCQYENIVGPNSIFLVKDFNDVVYKIVQDLNLVSQVGSEQEL